MADNNKQPNQFELTIKAYLDNMAATDAHFAEKYANPDKSIAKCCNYIINRVKKSGRHGFTDPEVYGMAVHYYDEQDIKDVEHTNCTVVVNHTIELTEEEKAAEREKAIREYHSEVISGLKKKPAQKKADDVLPNQMELFQ